MLNLRPIDFASAAEFVGLHHRLDDGNCPGALQLANEATKAIEDMSKQLAYYHGFDGFLMAHGMFGQVEWTPAECESVQEPPKEEV